MKATQKHTQYPLGCKVVIRPLEGWYNASGIVCGIRHDDKGDAIYDVKRGMDGNIHLCREFELKPLF